MNIKKAAVMVVSIISYFALGYFLGFKVMNVVYLIVALFDLISDKEVVSRILKSVPVQQNHTLLVSFILAVCFILFYISPAAFYELALKRPDEEDK